MKLTPAGIDLAQRRPITLCRIVGGESRPSETFVRVIYLWSEYPLRRKEALDESLLAISGNEPRH